MSAQLIRSKPSAVILIWMLCLASCATDQRLGDGWRPKDGFVPDEKTAIAIAVAVWNPLYGEKQITDQKPYHVSLRDGEWHVSGTLPPNMLGGVAHVIISKSDGRILWVTHGQ